MDLKVWDTWSYNWNSLNFSSKNSYKFLQGTQEASPLFLLALVYWYSRKTQIFVLAPHERPNTRNLPRRKNKALDDYNCAI
jgi:hypothetical protein